jgi:hypothetical protein
VQCINILQAKQSNASTQFYDANHLYLMKIAIIENLKKKAAPLQIIHNKEDLSNQNPVVSSTFRR